MILFVGNAGRESAVVTPEDITIQHDLLISKNFFITCLGNFHNSERACLPVYSVKRC